MPLRFRVLAQGHGTDRTVVIADGGAEIRIGRRADLELPLPFAALSAVHARVWRDGDGWRVEDLGSTNGSTLAGLPLPPHQPRPLLPGQRLEVGQVVLLFEGVADEIDGAPEPPAKRPDGTATIARRLVSDLFAAAPAASVAYLEVIGGPADGSRLPLREPDRTYLVGRDPRCDLPLGVEEVSREHAAFTRRWDGVFVRDLGSKNGIRVWGTAVASERRLGDGDLVEIGPLSVRLYDPEDRYLKELAALGEAGLRVPPPPPPADQPAPPPATAPPAAPPVQVASPASRGGGPAAATRISIVVAAMILAAVAAVAAALLLG